MDEDQYSRVYYLVCNRAKRKGLSSYNVYLIKDKENNYALPYQHFKPSESTPGHTIPKARTLLSTVFDNASSMRISSQPVVQWQGVQLYVVNQGEATIKERPANEVVWELLPYAEALVKAEETFPLVHAMVYIMLNSVALAKYLNLVEHLHERLARCRGALWFTSSQSTLVIPAGDRTQLQKFEHLMIAELRKCEIYVGEQDMCESMASLRSLCQSLLVQAPLDDEFEVKYWEAKPNDDYSRGIRLWHILSLPASQPASQPAGRSTL